MKIEVKVPSAGESVTEATVSSILKKTGSEVKEDEEILELETDKVNQMVYAPTAGKLELLVKVNDVVKVGQIIGYVDTAAKGEVEAPKPKAEPQPIKQAPAAPPPPKSAPVETGPTARKMIPEAIAEIKEKPKEIKKEPLVEKPQAAEVRAEGGAIRKKMSRLRKTIAERLVSVKNETAMLTTFNEVDMTNILAIRSKEQEGFTKRHGVKLGFMSFFIKATVNALKAYPEVNSYIDGDEIVTLQSYDIGVAVSTERGLIVPVIRNTDQMNFGDIEKSIAFFAEKAREGTISIDDLRGGSFTITNGGVFGSLLSTPILNPPQSAILGMHTILKRPVAINDQVVIRPMMYLALSYDHRIIDGRDAVLFLVHIKNTLEDPTRLLLDL